ncbi:MAG: 3-hydroxyisobutyrate dehydrogenase [Quisquiliibacterium sp.]
MNIAFIGLGNMGLPMSANLLRAGHSVTGYDLVADRVAEFVAGGGKAARSAAQAVQGAQVVITMLPASQHVRDAYLGDGGLLSQVDAQVLLIDCSTIAPQAAREVAAAAAAKGLAMIDAPVSGGTGGAVAGTLTFMVGGAAEHFERARPVLSRMGSNLFHAGASGAGQAAKVCNNMLAGIAMIATSEALRLGLANGLDAKVLSSIISKSSGGNWVVDKYNPCPGTMDNVPSARGYTGGFAVDLMLKDLGLAVENALDMRAAVPLGALARNLYDLHSKSGNGSLDSSSIYNMLGPKS